MSVYSKVPKRKDIHAYRRGFASVTNKMKGEDGIVYKITRNKYFFVIIRKKLSCRSFQQNVLHRPVGYSVQQVIATALER